MSASMAEVINLALGSFSLTEINQSLPDHIASVLAANGYGKLETRGTRGTRQASGPWSKS